MIDPLYPFVFLGLFSPGPNVILLTTSGARFGFRRTLPHLAGVVLGVGIVAGATGLGIGTLLLSMPRLELLLKVVAALWILVMAWRLWRAVPQEIDTASDTRQRPMTFPEALLFQWVNPKLWAVALAAVSAYPAGLAPMAEATRLASAFSGLNLIVCLFWVTTGTLLAYLMRSPLAWRIFNRVMAILLAGFSVLLFL